MVGGKLEGTEDERNGIRLMLVRAHGCRICVALDAVEGIFDVGAGAAAAASATLAHGTTVPLVEWGDVVAGSLGDHLLVRLEVVPGGGDDADHDEQADLVCSQPDNS